MDDFQKQLGKTVVEKLMDRVLSARGWQAILSTLLLAAVVFFMVALISWKSRRWAQEQHRKNLDKVKADMAKHQSRRAENDKKIKKLEESVKRREEKISRLERDIEKLRREIDSLGNLPTLPEV